MYADKKKISAISGLAIKPFPLHSPGKNVEFEKISGITGSRAALSSSQSKTLAEIMIQIGESARPGPPMFPALPYFEPGVPYDHLNLKNLSKPGLPGTFPDTDLRAIENDNEAHLTIAAMPAFNEEKYIAKIIIGCRKYVDKVVVVDDGSSDATAEIAEALGAIVIKHPENMGYGGALQTIFKTAREMNADAMLIIDSDGQHDPREIPKLLEPLNNGTDLVIGSRFINGNGQSVPAYRKAGMKVLDIATNIAGGINISDSQSGFRAYGRKAIEKISIKDNDMPAGSEILMQIKDHDLKFKEVGIHCNYDVENASSQNPVSHGFSVLMSILNNVGEKRPVLFLGLPGTIFILIGIFYGGWTLQLYSSTKILPIGNALISVMTTLIGVFSVFTAIILYTITNFVQRTGLAKRP